jgi:hypothetical protein
MSNAHLETAVQRFRTLAGLGKAEAEELVQAVLDASHDQSLETMGGSGPIPSNVNAARAEHVRFVCLRANRILDQREVEVLFRVTSTTARSILATMRATYEEALRQQFLERMRRDATVRASGTDQAGLTWRVTFTETATFEIARTELLRLGKPEMLLDESSTRHMIEISKESKVGGKTALELLGVPAPSSG